TTSGGWLDPSGCGPLTSRGKNYQSRSGYRPPRSIGPTIAVPIRDDTDRWHRQWIVPSEIHKNSGPPGSPRSDRARADTAPALPDLACTESRADGFLFPHFWRCTPGATVGFDTPVDAGSTPPGLSSRASPR